MLSKRFFDNAKHKSLVACFSRCLTTNSSVFNLPPIRGEKMLSYIPGSPELLELKEAVNKMAKECPEIPLVINGERVKTGVISKQTIPSEKTQEVCKFHVADESHVKSAIKASLAAKKTWENVSFERRTHIYLRAAELMAKRRAEICSALILGVSKNCWQAEIDVAEAIDFVRLAPYFAQKLYSMQPPLNTVGSGSRIDHRPLEGFVAAISPFNFSAIGVNLPAAPAFVGNTAVWKPSQRAILGNYLMFKALEDAGLPAGVINFVPCGDAKAFSKVVTSHRDLAGVHFTGSTEVFEDLWKAIGKNIHKYRSYPRLVGETGGKNFHFAHVDADQDTLLHQSIRSAFEYNGQKCSALSRLYVPRSVWEGGFKERLVAEVGNIRVGQPYDRKSFVTALISESSWDKAAAYIDEAERSEDCEVLVGGKGSKDRGFFINPTVVEVKTPKNKLMTDEIFAPIISVRVYEDDNVGAALDECSKSAYGLTGSVFAKCPMFIERASLAFRHSAGNFNVNDKCTGAVVGEQPFGGARKSGTNDKAGCELNLMRWVSPRTIKENFVPLTSYRYPHMV